MIAVSSFRPSVTCAEPIRVNQLAAKESWDRAFDRVIYVGEAEPGFVGPQTEFVPNTGKSLPSIRRLTEICAALECWSCIINADIIVGDQLRAVERRLVDSGARCAVSQRYEIITGGDLSQGKVVDQGLDFFCAAPEVWRVVSENVPPEFTLGRVLWDEWILGFFVLNYGDACYDLTSARLIFHPRHGHRQDQRVAMPSDPREKGRLWESWKRSLFLDKSAASDERLKQRLWPACTLFAP